eukprot:CAMPEP_0195508872 /NCGR_PEP_ID=MMETSP0794_2-20130614/1968_1 /TAXON_ID=515487 /ORGANISM="Stephanopyxis turris, Strain CCMP 815" /LENGTH=267 /DNA_ID=CAMNT_0040635953 /DNA_START=99 /DNA_END=902 /DNA_ORIENTATION=+
MALRRRQLLATTRTLSSSITKSPDTDLAIPGKLYKDTDMTPDPYDEKSPVEVYTQKMTSMDNSLVYADTLLPDTPPVLPEDPSEISKLDEQHNMYDADHFWDGHTKRLVHIRQIFKNPCQSPMGTEQEWTIAFEDEGQHSQKWENPLMGWKSGADPMASNGLQMRFDSAKEAVYFAKLRGYNFVVDEPILRLSRDDGATYQDNFLPKPVAYKVMADGTKCDHWHRDKAGCSHYFRPLKYHGDGEVDQYGPNGDAPKAPHVDGKYKRR